MKSKSFSIIDLEGFAKSMRLAASVALAEQQSGEDREEDLDDYISLRQTTDLIKNRSLGKDEEDNYIINKKIFNRILDELGEWIYGVGLSKLASGGFVECVWDDKSNTMIFYLPNDESKTVTSNPPKGKT